MKLTVLGSSGTYAGRDNACSGYLVEASGVTVLIDAGPGTLSELQRHMALEDLDALVISHSHPDHWVEAPVLRNALRYVIGSGGLAVHSTTETLEMISAVCHERVSPTFEMSAIEDGSEIAVGPLRIRCSRTDHPPETLAFRVDDGQHRIAYSSDTGPAWSFAELGGPVDLGICEATFREGTDQVLGTVASERVHMTAAEAGAMARATGAAELLITHLLPGAETSAAAAEASAAYGAAVSVATRGFTVEL